MQNWNLACIHLYHISEMCWHLICVSSIVPLLYEEVCGLAKRLEIEQAAVTNCLVVCISSIWHSGVCVRARAHARACVVRVCVCARSLTCSLTRRHAIYLYVLCYAARFFTVEYVAIHKLECTKNQTF